MTARESFHAHLADCARCRETPFHLCPAGDRLLKAAAATEMDEARARVQAKHGKPVGPKPALVTERIR